MKDIINYIIHKIKKYGWIILRSVFFCLVMGVMLVLFFGGGYLAIISLFKGFIDILLCSLGVFMFILAVWFMNSMFEDMIGKK